MNEWRKEWMSEWKKGYACKCSTLNADKWEWRKMQKINENAWRWMKIDGNMKMLKNEWKTKKTWQCMKTNEDRSKQLKMNEN